MSITSDREKLNRISKLNLKASFDNQTVSGNLSITYLEAFKETIGLAINITVLIFAPGLGRKSFSITWSNLIEMLSVVPPIFVLLGLLDVWIKRETMVKLMGEKSKFVGILIAFFLGSAAAGPLYAAFPIAGMLLKKGSKFSNVLIFIEAWSTTKIPLLLFEASSMGWRFMLLRFVLDIPVIVLIAYITEKALKQSEIDGIYMLAEKMGK